jgi:hypothetical protein
MNTQPRKDIPDNQRVSLDSKLMAATIYDAFNSKSIFSCLKFCYAVKIFQLTAKGSGRFTF